MRQSEKKRLEDLAQKWVESSDNSELHNDALVSLRRCGTELIKLLIKFEKEAINRMK